MGEKSKYKIKPSSFLNEKKNIQPTTPSDEEVSFSFQYIREKDNKFKYSEYSEKENNYFIKIVERFKEVCKMSKRCLVTSNSKSLRNHKIDWDKTTENGFGLTEQYDESAFQISISANKHGRVHGFYINNIFYIVWFDPKHELYS